MNFSVLMSVYCKERPEYLKLSIESILNQTLMPSELVIVKDGPLGEELDSTIYDFESNYQELIKVVNLEKNVGLGEALQIGLINCSHPIVARMDTDDICLPYRFERQIEYLEMNPSVDVVGSWVEEFNGDISIESNLIKKVPIDYEIINRKARYRNPINHMSVVFKKQAVTDSGNYQPLLWNEDYYLWVRMISKGYRITNLPEVLVYVRAGDDMYRRRSGVKYIQSEIKLQKKMLDLKFINYMDFLINISIRTIIRLIPNNWRSFVYQKLLRNKI